MSKPELNVSGQEVGVDTVLAYNAPGGMGYLLSLQSIIALIWSPHFPESPRNR
jgi:hypothetical protein